MTPTEAEALAMKVTDYYVNVANRDKVATVNHFVDPGDKRSRERLFKMIRRFEVRGTAEYSKSVGPRPTLPTQKLMQKLIPLYNANPALSVSEAATLLKSPPSTVFKLMRRLKANSKYLHRFIPPSDEGDTNDISISKEKVIVEENEASQTKTEKDLPSPGTDFDSSCNNYGDDCYDDTIDTDSINDAVTNSRVKNDPSSSSSSSKVNIVLNSKLVSNKTIDFKSLKKSRDNRCLVCLGPVPKKNAFKKLSNNSKAIFLLKNMIGITLDDLVKFMTQTGGDCPSEWFGLCEKCQKQLDKAYAFHEIIMELEKKIYHIKEALMSEMKSSSEKERHKNGKRISTIVWEIVMSEGTKKVVNDQGDKEPQNEFIQPTNASTVTNCVFGNKVDDDFVFNDDFNDNNDESTSIGNRDKYPLETDLFAVSNECRNEEISSTNDVNDKWSNKPLESNANEGSEQQIPSVSKPGKVTAFCEICGEDIKFQSLAYHMWTGHEIIMEGFSLLECDVPGCEFKTLFPDYIAKHKRQKHGTKKVRGLPCQFCGKEFSRKSGLQNHEDSHINKEARPYKCDVCLKGFAVRTSLYIHKRLSHEKRKFPCHSRKRERR